MEYILELVEFDESTIVLNESSFSDIIERIKAWFHKILAKIRLFFSRLVNSQKIIIASNKKFIDNNWDKIKKGYEIFTKTANASIKDDDIFNIVDTFEEKLYKKKILFNNKNDIIKDLKGDLDALVIMSKRKDNNEEELPSSNILSNEPEEEYEYNAHEILGLLNAEENNIEYHKFSEALKNTVDKSLYESRGLENIPIDKLKEYATDNKSSSVGGITLSIKFLEKDLSNISQIGREYKSAISLFKPAYRAQANKILNRARILLNDYISICMEVQNTYIQYEVKARKYAINLLKLYASFADKESFPPNEEYNLNGTLIESTTDMGIFESVKFI